MPLRPVPKLFMPVMAATAISAAINPYSMAVAPRLSAINADTNFDKQVIIAPPFLFPGQTEITGAGVKKILPGFGSADVIIVAAGALVDSAGKILVQRRPQGGILPGLWEFPGGKLEPNETAEAALIRELHEELGIHIDPADVQPLSFTTAETAAGTPLLLLLFRISRWEGDPRALHADAVAWHTPHQLRSIPMPPADVPLVAALMREA